MQAILLSYRGYFHLQKMEKISLHPSGENSSIVVLAPAVRSLASTLETNFNDSECKANCEFPATSSHLISGHR